MKRLMIVAVILAMTSGLAFSQDVVLGDKSLKFGLGAAFGKESLPMGQPGMTINGVDFPSFYVPIIIGSNIRFEPFFGMVQWKMDDGTDIQKMGYMEFGAGLFFLQWIGPVDLYFGVRGGLFIVSMSEENGDKETASRSDFFVGPAIGGEYFFTPHLSLGGEVQFIFMQWGEWKYDPEINGGDDYKTTIMKTRPLFFIRWYF